MDRTGTDQTASLTHRTKRLLMAVLAAALLASVIAIPSPASAAAVGRFGGVNRYETAAAISQAFDGCQVVVASGQDFPDGLAGSVFGVPVLLTETNELPFATAAELDRLANEICGGFLQDIGVFGGSAAVSSAVFDELESFAPGRTERVAGANRYETAVEVAQAYISFFPATDTVLLATGQDFPDALAAGPLAAGAGYPILLNDGNTVRRELIEFFDSNPAVSNAIILGGTAAVPLSVEEQLGSQLGVTTERVAGADRFETAAMIADLIAAGEAGAPPPGALLVNGNAFPDALSGGPLGRAIGPILLADQALPIPPSTSDWLVANTPEFVLAVGGTAVVSDAVLIDAAATASP